MDHVVGERRIVDGNGIHGLCFGRVHRPREFLPVEDEDLIVAAQFAQARPRDIGEFHLGIFGCRGALGAFDDILPTAARGLGHLVVLTALRIVKLLPRLTRVMRQKPSAKSQRLDLHKRRQGEGMQPPKTASFVKKLSHARTLPRPLSHGQTHQFKFSVTQRAHPVNSVNAVNSVPPKLHQKC